MNQIRDYQGAQKMALGYPVLSNAKEHSLETEIVRLRNLADSIAKEIDRLGSIKIRMVGDEPMTGNVIGGILPEPNDYLSRVRDLSKKYEHIHDRLTSLVDRLSDAL